MILGWFARGHVSVRRWFVIACLGGSLGGSLTACSHNVPPTSGTANQPSPCDRLADHLVSLMDAAQHAKPEELDPYRNLISKRCTEDHWGPEAQQCLTA